MKKKENKNKIKFRLLSLLFCFVFLSFLILLPDGVQAQQTQPPATHLLSSVFGPLGTILSGDIGTAASNAGTFLLDKVNDLVFKQIGMWIGSALLKLGTFIALISGTFFDAVLNLTVVRMKESIDAIAGISIAWSALRDIGNIFFIFILLYISISMVLQLQGGNARKLLTRVIIMALLINFSLFFTRVIIDVSNALTVAYYNSVTGGTTSISSRFADAFNFQSFSDWTPKGDAKPSAVWENHGFLIGVLGFGVQATAAGVWLAAGALFVWRYVMLILLMITSGLAFAAMALPNDKYSGSWWQALWGQVIFAPVFMILTWVTLLVLGGVLQFLGLGAGINWTTGLTDILKSEGSTGTPDYTNIATLVTNFAIVIGLMISSLIVSKEVSGKAGSGIRNWIGGVVGGATVGATAWGGRQIFGRAAQRTLEDRELNRKAASGNIGARLQLQAAKGIASSSFDIRNTGAGKQLGLGKAGGKGGFAASEKTYGKETEGYLKGMRPSDLEVYKAEQGLTEAQEKTLSSEPVKGMDSLIEKRVEDIENTKRKIKAQYEKGTQPGATPQQTALAEKIRKESEEDLKKAQGELSRAREMRSKLVEHGTVSAQSKVEQLKPEKIKEQQEAVVKKIAQQWGDLSRGARYSVAKKAIKEKSKLQKAIEDSVKEFDEEKEGGKEKEQKEEKKEE